MEFKEIRLLIEAARKKRIKSKKMFSDLKKPKDLNSEIDRIIFHNVEYLINSEGTFTMEDIQYLPKYKLTTSVVNKLKTALKEYIGRK
jgi:hypothetical protein